MRKMAAVGLSVAMTAAGGAAGWGIAEAIPTSEHIASTQFAMDACAPHLPPQGKENTSQLPPACAAYDQVMRANASIQKPKYDLPPRQEFKHDQQATISTLEDYKTIFDRGLPAILALFGLAAAMHTIQGSRLKRQVSRDNWSPLREIS